MNVAKFFFNSITEFKLHRGSYISCSYIGCFLYIAGMKSKNFSYFKPKSYCEGFVINKVNFWLPPDDGSMINLTEWAAQSGKQLCHWFETFETLEFICGVRARSEGFAHDNPEFFSGVKVIMDEVKSSLKDKKLINTQIIAKKFPELVKVVRGGIPGKTNPGTWVTRPLAIRFYGWLYPGFEESHTDFAC